MSTQFFTERRRDVLLLVFSIAGMLFLVGRGIFIAVTGFISLTSVAGVDSSSGWLSSISMFFCASLLIPLLVYCIRRLKGGVIPPARVQPIRPFQLVGLTVVWVLMIVLGSIFTSRAPMGNAIAIPAFLIGISVPVVGLGWIAIGGLPMGSRRRLWAAFGIGLAGSTFGAMLLEYLLVGVGVLAVGIVAALDPQLRIALQQIMNQVSNGGDIQNILTNLAPYLTNPIVLLVALLFASVLAPIIEESLKTSGSLAARKKASLPGGGVRLRCFVRGGLCHAGGNAGCWGNVTNAGSGDRRAGGQFVDAYHCQRFDGLGDCFCPVGKTLRPVGGCIYPFDEPAWSLEWFRYPGSLWSLALDSPGSWNRCAGFDADSCRRSGVGIDVCYDCSPASGFQRPVEAGFGAAYCRSTK